MIRFTKLAAIALICLGLGLVGCENDSGDRREGPRAGSASEGHESAVGPERRDGELAGRLLVRPKRVVAGGQTRASVQNTGSATMFCGRAMSFQRRDGERWVPATREILGNRIGVRGIGLILEPTEIARGIAANRFQVEADAEPGVYRLVKRVSSDGRRGSAREELPLSAVFEVLPAGYESSNR